MKDEFHIHNIFDLQNIAQLFGQPIVRLQKRPRVSGQHFVTLQNGA